MKSSAGLSAWVSVWLVIWLGAGCEGRTPSWWPPCPQVGAEVAGRWWTGRRRCDHLWTPACPCLPLPECPGCLCAPARSTGGWSSVVVVAGVVEWCQTTMQTSQMRVLLLLTWNMSKAQTWAATSKKFGESNKKSSWQMHTDSHIITGATIACW